MAVDEKAAVVAAGALPPLIELMTKQDEPSVQLEAIAAVGNLAVNGDTFLASSLPLCGLMLC